MYSKYQLSKATHFYLKSVVIYSRGKFASCPIHGKSGKNVIYDYALKISKDHSQIHTFNKNIKNIKIGYKEERITNNLSF